MAIKFNFNYSEEMFKNIDVTIDHQKWFQNRYGGKHVSIFNSDSELELMRNYHLQGAYLADKDKVIIKYLNPTLKALFAVCSIFSKQLRQQFKATLDADKNILPHELLHVIQFRNFYLDGRTIREVNTELGGFYFATPEKQKLLEKLEQVQYEAEIDAYCFDVVRLGVGTTDDIANVLATMYPVALKVCKDTAEIKADADERLEYIKQNLHMFKPIMG
jgi:hypothetical protein